MFLQKKIPSKEKFCKFVRNLQLFRGLEWARKTKGKGRHDDGYEDIRPDVEGTEGPRLYYAEAKIGCHYYYLCLTRHKP